MSDKKEQSVVGYCRSTSAIEDRSPDIELQKDALRRFAERRRLVIQRFYCEDDQRGPPEERALDRLLSDCQAGLVGTVLITSLDQLSQDPDLAANVVATFKMLGVRVLIADMSNSEQ